MQPCSILLLIAENQVSMQIRTLCHQVQLLDSWTWGRMHTATLTAVPNLAQRMVSTVRPVQIFFRLLAPKPIVKKQLQQLWSV